MADKNTLLLVAGLGALYFILKPNSAFAYPSTSPTPKPPTGSNTGSGSGISFGGGSGGSSGQGTVTGGGGGSYQYQPTSGGPVVNCPGDPSCPGGGVDSGDACDPTSVAYDPQLCNVEQGTDSQNICDPASYFYDASQCTGADTNSTYPIDSGDPCDPSSFYYDASLCNQNSLGGSTYDTPYPDDYSMYE